MVYKILYGLTVHGECPIMCQVLQMIECMGISWHNTI